jgi:two-component system, cell cycle sensor histidine kinase and response regulator CckA
MVFPTSGTSRGTDLPTPLIDALRLAREVLQADEVSVLLAGEDVPLCLGASADAAGVPQEHPLTLMLLREVSARGDLVHSRPRASAGECAAAPVSFTGLPIRSRAGELLGSLGVIRRNGAAAEPAPRGVLELIAAQIATEITLRRRAADEAEVRRRLQILERALDQTQVGVTITDAFGRIVYANPAEAHRHGYAVTELVGQPAKMLGPPERAASVVPQRIREIRSWTRESVGVTKHGERFPVLLWSDTFSDESGNPAGMVTCSQDIRERKRVEAALRESEERLRQIAETTRDVLWICDLAGSEFYYVSPAYETVWGASRQSLYDDATSFLERVHPLDRPRALEAMRSWKPGAAVEYRVIRPDGRVRWVCSRGEPVRNEQGEIYRIAGHTIDITEKKLSQEARLDAEAHYRRLVDTSPYGIYAVDLGGRFIEVNASAEQIIGRPSEVLIGSHFGQYAHCDDAAAAGAAFEQVVTGARDHLEIELRIVRPDGEIRHLSLSATAIARDGLICGVHGIARDITEQQRVEAQLMQAQRMEAVGRLAGGIAHDFNNNLTAILGFAKFLESEISDDGPGSEFLREINKAAQRSASLTRQLLAFSGKQVLRPKVLDVNAVVANVGALLRRLLDKEIELAVLPAALDALVEADPSQLEQVLINLVLNARDATPDGGHIVVRTDSERVLHALPGVPHTVPPGDYVVLSVVDSGSGIDASVLAHIFEPFFTTKGPTGGTGLGLSMALGVVEQSGGYLSVTTQLGGGTRFDIYLPVAPPAVEPEPLPPACGGACASTSSQKGLVLLAEDEVPLRMLMKTILKRHGYAVLDAENGQEALRMWEAERGRITAVVTDLMMPIMGGRELARRICADDGDIPILFISGYTDDPDLPECAPDRGHFLAKPFLPGRLVEALEALCGRLAAT